MMPVTSRTTHHEWEQANSWAERPVAEWFDHLVESMVSDQPYLDRPITTAEA